MDVQIIETKIGLLKILSKNDIVYKASFLDDNISPLNNINDSVFASLVDYFDGDLDIFPFKYKLKGTSFQIKVWKEISKIPYGTTKSYSDIAKAIGFPKSYRAVANACGQNQIILFIPCHRVIGKNNLGGYKYGIDRKKFLLEMEKSDT